MAVEGTSRSAAKRLRGGRKRGKAHSAPLFLLDDPQLHVVKADAGVRGDLPV